MNKSRYNAFKLNYIELFLRAADLFWMNNSKNKYFEEVYGERVCNWFVFSFLSVALNVWCKSSEQRF